MTNPVNILLLEDSSLDAELIRAQVKKAHRSAQVDRVITREEFEKAIEDSKYDLILSDFALPDFDGLSALEIAHKRIPHTPFIFVSGTLGEDVAVESLQNGATDYVLKQRLERLAPAIRRALEEKTEKELRRQSEHQLKASEKRFRELADAMPQLVWTTDVRGQITYCNRHAREYAGFAPVNQSPPGIELSHPDDHAQMTPLWSQCLDDIRLMEVEWRLKRASDGNYRWHLTRFVPMCNEAGKVEGWIATAVDVEEQKRREHALQQSETALMQSNMTLEQKVQERTEAYQKLSARLLHIQDIERRRIARELHDSLGQYLSGLKINLEILNRRHNGISEERREELLTQSVHLLRRCISETRTTSYLLHPPMLDEAGFSLAARWYVDGFGERSGIRTKVEFPEERLPQQIEVVLFRVLQECLTNVHRHARSQQVDISVTIKEQKVELRVRDYGSGIPEDRLKTFRNGGSGVGVGLAGMRERVRELGGSFDITRQNGTVVTVTIPLAEKINSEASVSMGGVSSNQQVSA